MKKSTFSKSLSLYDLIPYEKPLPKSAKKQTLDNILAFSRSYSVRKSSELGQIEFILN